MPSMNIILEGDGALRDRDLSRLQIADNTKPLTVVLLNNGMESGAHSVSFYIEMPDGSSVFAETSLKLFMGAADAFRRAADPAYVARQRATGRKASKRYRASRGPIPPGAAPS